MNKEKQLISQRMREISPEMDPLRLGTGWSVEDLSKPQIFIESTFGDSHPGSGHLDKLVAAAREGVSEEGGHGARYFTTDMCDGESQGTDGINYSLASREMIANMIEIQANATPFDAGVRQSHGTCQSQYSFGCCNGRHNGSGSGNAHAGTTGHVFR